MGKSGSYELVKIFRMRRILSVSNNLCTKTTSMGTAKEVDDYTKSINLAKKLFHAVKDLKNGKLCIDSLEPPPKRDGNHTQ